MRATVQLELPDGSAVHLNPGDVIGRTWTAALRIDDPGISEAHALVSLRGHALKLLALRGRFLVNDQPQTEADLAPGQVIRLSRETTVKVTDVDLPDAVLAIEGDGLPQQILSGTAALWLRPTPRLARGYDPRADALLWTGGDGWRLRPEALAGLVAAQDQNALQGAARDQVLAHLAQGQGGLETEHEDIRTHVLPFARAMGLIPSGEAANGPLVLCLLWLERERDRLRAGA